jgi:tetratricopeptide (TPR) repeat protein
MSNKRIHITILLLSILSFALLAAHNSSSPAGIVAGSAVSSEPLRQAIKLSSALNYAQAEAMLLQIQAENPGSSKALEAQRQLIHIAIAQKDQKKAEAAFNKMLADYSQNATLGDAIYNVGKDYQYNAKNAAKALEIHKYNIEHFPNTKYAMLSSAEIVRSYVRDGKAIADAEVEKWLNTYKNQPDRVIGLYQLGRAYADTKKDEQALKLFSNAIANYPNHLYSQLSQVRYNTTKRNYDAADTTADTLVKAFPDNEDVRENIRSLAEFYRDKKQYARAAHFYTAEIENWPDYDQPVVPYREAIYCYINMKDAANADALLEQMQTNLAKDPKLARTNFDIGNYYLNTAKDPNNALKVHKYNADHYTNIIEAMWSQAALVWYHVRHDDQVNADTEYTKLLAVYAEQETLPKEVYQIADIYKQKKKYGMALSLYQYQLGKWPQYGNPVDIYRKMVCTYIDMKDSTNAETVTAQMQTKFAEDSRLARANFDIGNYYLNDAKDPAKALQMHQFNADTYPTIMEAMWSQAAIVWYYARHNDNAQADAAYAKMLSVFKDQKTLPKEVFQIGDIYTEVGDTAKARTLQNQVMEEWPQSEYVFNARVGLIKADVADGKVADVLTGLDKLIADYKDNSQLPMVLINQGKSYWDKAREEQKRTNPRPDMKAPPANNEKVLNQKAKDDFETARIIWEKMTTELPNANLSSEAHHYIALVYDEIFKDYQKALEHYQIVVDKWPNYQRAAHCQYMVGQLYSALQRSGKLSAAEAEPKIKDAYEKFLEQSTDVNKGTVFTAQKWLDVYEKLLPEAQNLGITVSQLAESRKTNNSGKGE